MGGAGLWVHAWGGCHEGLVPLVGGGHSWEVARGGDTRGPGATPAPPLPAPRVPSWPPPEPLPSVPGGPEPPPGEPCPVVSPRPAGLGELRGAARTAPALRGHRRPAAARPRPSGRGGAVRGWAAGLSRPLCGLQQGKALGASRAGCGTSGCTLLNTSLRAQGPKPDANRPQTRARGRGSLPTPPAWGWGRLARGGYRGKSAEPSRASPWQHRLCPVTSGGVAERRVRAGIRPWLFGVPFGRCRLPAPRPLAALLPSGGRGPGKLRGRSHTATETCSCPILAPTIPFVPAAHLILI